MTTGGDDTKDVLSDTSVAVAVKVLIPSDSTTPENEKVPELLVGAVPTDVPLLNSLTSE